MAKTRGTLLAGWLALLLVAAGALLLAGRVSAVKAGYEKGLAAKIRTPWHHWRKNEEAETRVIVGQRIPRRYFVTKGFGETDEGAGANPYETGAHDLAMEDAGIHNFNLMVYTSIMPPEAEEITLEEAQRYFHHGAVLECIMAEMYGGRGDRVTAGVGRMGVVDRRLAAAHGTTTDNKSGLMGGFAVEYVGHGSEAVARQQLDESLSALFDRRFTSDDHSQLERLYTIESKEVTKAYGVAMAGICFVDYIVPVLKGNDPSELQQAARHKSDAGKTEL